MGANVLGEQLLEEQLSMGGKCKGSTSHGFENNMMIFMFFK
jgi:hypothetical protein